MNGTESQKVWEVSSDQPPPASVEGVIEQGEQLLWVGVVPSRAMRSRTIAFGAVSVILTVAMIASAPWGQSIAEYCGPGPGRGCRSYHFFVWLLIPCGAYLSVGSAYTVWRSDNAPWIFTYAISDRRAYIVDGRKPKLFKTVDLNLHKARLSTGNVVFGRGRDKLPGFGGLNPDAAKRAVYWANEGRLRPEFQPKPPP